MNEILVILSLFFLLLCGYATISLFDLLPTFAWYEKIPYAYGLGVGLLSFQLFLYSQFDVPWHKITILLPWLGYLLSIIWIKRAALNTERRLPSTSRVHLLDVFLLLLLVLTVLYTGFEVSLRPLFAWDGWAIWLLKAKVFYIDGFVNPAIYSVLRESYPYIINVSVAYLFTIVGQADDRAVLLFFYFSYIALGWAFFFFVKRKANLRKALLFTFLLLSLQNVLRHGGRFEAGYADLTLGFYMFSVFSLLHEYMNTHSHRVLLLLSLFLGITRLIKEEGLVFLIIVQTIIFYITLIKSRDIKAVFLSLFWLIPVGSWELFKIQHNIHYSLYTQTVIHGSRIFEILRLTIKEMFNIQNWNIAWIVFVIGLLLSVKQLFRKNMLAYLLIFGQMTAYILVFMVSPHEPSVHVKNVIDRLFLHIIPLALFTIAVV